MRFLELLYVTRVALFAAFCSFLQLFVAFTSFWIFCIFLQLLQFFAIFGSFRSHKIMICIFHCCLETEYGIIFHFIPCYTYFFVIFALLCAAQIFFLSGSSLSWEFLSCSLAPESRARYGSDMKNLRPCVLHLLVIQNLWKWNQQLIEKFAQFSRNWQIDWIPKTAQ